MKWREAQRSEEIKEAQILMMSVGRKQQSAGENYLFQESGF